MTSPPRGKCLLQSLLESANMTQTELSKKSGVSQRMISYYASNEKVMSIDAAKAISASLGCEMRDLCWWPDEQ